MKLSELLKIKETQTYFPRWNNNEKIHILKHLSNTTDLNELFNWTQADDFHCGVVFSMPCWFLLTYDHDLLSALIKHPLIKEAIQECSNLEKKNICQTIGMPLLNIMSYPFVFNYDIKAIKLLIKVGYEVNNTFASSLLREKQYDLLLKLYEENLLKFDEQELIKADPLNRLYQNTDKPQKTLLDSIIINIEEQDENDKLETFILVENLFHLGMKNCCYVNNNLSCELKKIKDEKNKILTLEEILEYLPKSHAIYEKIKLKKELSKGLANVKNESLKVKSKI